MQIMAFKSRRLLVESSQSLREIPGRIIRFFNIIRFLSLPSRYCEEKKTTTTYPLPLERSISSYKIPSEQRCIDGRLCDTEQLPATVHGRIGRICCGAIVR